MLKIRPAETKKSCNYDLRCQGRDSDVYPTDNVLAGSSSRTGVRKAKRCLNSFLARIMDLHLECQ